jgi:hypothetical protein
MPITSGWFSNGTNYTNFFAPVSVCCPSRVVGIVQFIFDDESRSAAIAPSHDHRAF